ncbi:methyltransferase domain-containing protein [Saccharopolyspora sp. HNM0983]|uniref:Methyltransferase domain-containing protein n=2 Tax=Saccharopolyspora montiporae TaxID=2781240 RepID=A0A929B847_9PSEU|nr:methyltransferase domain-containing protein [Saccharopolyspora sp. HNM0983]MBE9374999.1 methyltransferase domain-containing protein [Saccharopolyspora sp. HNM0983]
MIGAATPTTAATAATVAQVVPTTGRPVVVELGPGTGSLSNGIARRLPEGARHIGIELSRELAEHLRSSKPWMHVAQGDAGDLRALLDGMGVDRADAVISSIPWSLLSGADQEHILEQVTASLRPHGAFTALTYVPAGRTSGGRQFRSRLGSTFDEVVTHTTWRSFPPILHYICRRPLHRPAQGARTAS